MNPPPSPPILGGPCRVVCAPLRLRPPGPNFITSGFSPSNSADKRDTSTLAPNHEYLTPRQSITQQSPGLGSIRFRPRHLTASSPPFPPHRQIRVGRIGSFTPSRHPPSILHTPLLNLRPYRAQRFLAQSLQTAVSPAIVDFIPFSKAKVQRLFAWRFQPPPVLR
ncbi:hypothetical protein F1880_002166 [Penicillium rolfsii]|nr:hypothetical protein F1880_002166 [Penicillium rolfsii]